MMSAAFRKQPMDEAAEVENKSEEEEEDEGGVEDEVEPEQQQEVPPGQSSQSEVPVGSSSDSNPKGSAVQSSVDSPDACWESSLLSASALPASEHVRAIGGLHQESVAECFCFDDQELHLRQINLHPSRWTPELYPPQHATHPPASCHGYYTLTILGLNQKVAIDARFLPVWSAKDPRAASISWRHHDNSLLSCLVSGHLCPPPNTAGSTDTPLPTPEEVVNSASLLEHEHLVCVLDLCLLGDGKTEVICSKVYRMSEIITPQTNSTQ